MIEFINFFIFKEKLKRFGKKALPSSSINNGINYIQS